ncbi:hypothetical protein [Succinimonas sp.]|uniref:hypothetical protein n=1 Tax=Succinimonas sp. TaxID=1936151 RepID=UPI0038679973
MAAEKSRRTAVPGERGNGVRRRLASLTLSLTALSSLALLSGCGYAAAAYIARETPLSEKRELRAQNAGYQAFMEILPGAGHWDSSLMPCGRIKEFYDTLSGKASCLPVFEVNAVHLPEFSMLEFRTGHELSRYAESGLRGEDPAGLPQYGTVSRLFLYPETGIYTFQGRTMDARGRKVQEQGFQAEDPVILFRERADRGSGAGGFVFGLPWLYLLDFYTGRRASECDPAEFREEGDYPLLSRCVFRAPGYSGSLEYQVREWISFDRGLYFPRTAALTGTGSRGAVISFQGARELNPEQLRQGRNAALKAAEEIRARIQAGELPVLRDPAAADELLRQL